MIRILDSFVADKISAGEVIERPVSAVKELIENSIDAGASSVIVEIRRGGLEYIRVTDDGSGISSDDMELAFKRHATSKISTAADLDNITSLGFRGEALASISAVSRITIVSRTNDEISGLKSVLHASAVISSEKIGANKGTTIIVEDLFYNTPARRKFMKSETREASAIIEMVQQYAVRYSDVRFMMINNGATLFTTQGSGDTEAVVKLLFPDSSHSSLLTVCSDKIRGLISSPGTTLSSRKGQIFFVNGRPVTSKIIEKALTEGYGGRIFSGFPVAILFIDVDPYEIDVNIHPGKREVLFLHADAVASNIRDAVSKAIDDERSVPAIHTSSKYDKGSYSEYLQADITSPSYEISEQSSIEDFLAKIDRRDSDALTGITDAAGQSVEEEVNPEVEALEDSKSICDDFFKDLVYKGYIFDTYIIMEKGDAAYVFDQHAAHERIFYEKLSSAYERGEKFSQPILSPAMINVSSDIYRLKDDIIKSLTSLGYDISDFGERSFIIRAIPSYMSSSEGLNFAEAFCSSDDISDRVNDSVMDKLIMRSCKAAVKGGDRLSVTEISSLMSDLSRCSNPYSCPHGRPTFIKITKYETEKAFKRR